MTYGHSTAALNMTFSLGNILRGGEVSRSTFSSHASDMIYDIGVERENKEVGFLYSEFLRE
jgi:hypothetical protein